MDIAKAYYASDKSIDFSKLKGPFVISNTLLYNSELLELRFNGERPLSIEIVDRLAVVPVNSGSGVVRKFVGKSVESTIAFDLSDLDILYYDSKIITSDGSPAVTLKGHWLLSNSYSIVEELVNEYGDNPLDKISLEYGRFVNEDGDKYEYAINVDVARKLLEKPKKFVRNKSATNNSSCDKEIKNMGIGGVNLGQIVGLKMLNSITKGQDLDLGKLMLVQSLAGGQPIEIGDVMKAKLMSAIAKDNNSLEELPLDKLILYKMFDSGNIDINQIIQLKIMSKLFDEDDEKK